MDIMTVIITLTCCKVPVVLDSGLIHGTSKCMNTRAHVESTAVLERLAARRRK